MVVVKYLGGKVDHLEIKGIIHLSMVRNMAQWAKKPEKDKILDNPLSWYICQS